MEPKRLAMMMLLSFAVIFGWRMFVEHMYTQHPEWKRPGQTETTQTPPPTSGPATTQVAIATAPTTQPATMATTVATTVATTQAAPSMTASNVRVISSATQPTQITLGDAPGYSLTVKLTTTGAGIDLIGVKKPGDGSFAAPDRKGDYVYQAPFDETKPETRALATRSINVGAVEFPVAALNWNLERHDERSATFMLDFGVVHLRKIYELSDNKSPGKGYELTVRHTVENVSSAPVKVKIAFNGPNTPPRESERGPDLQIIGGYDGGYDRVTVEHHMIDEYGTKKPEIEITRSADKPLLWAGTLSVYFDALVRPMPLDKSSSPKYIEKISSYSFNPDAESYDRHGGMTFFTGELSVDAGKTLDLPNLAYFGPRWRSVLDDEHYAAFPLGFNNSLVLTSGPCSFCTFPILINGLVKLLGFFHFITRDWGLAIICLVILVRAILHPITKKSQVSMMRMGKLGPEMERLKKKYENDKDELNRQMMALYKDQGIGMYLGCLPMFLQMPIWIALWSALQSTFELRQAQFLWGYTWIHDLARPDRLLSWNPVHIPLGMIGTYTVSSLNILPLFMGVVMFLQQKYTPQPPSTTPEQEAQKKMMLWMSTLLFPLFLYSGPSGLNLYILTSTTIGIIESKRIRAHIKQQEELEKAGKIIVDAPKSMKKKRDDDSSGGGGGKRPPKTPKPQGGFKGWLAEIQAKAEEIKRQAEKK